MKTCTPRLAVLPMAAILLIAAPSIHAAPVGVKSLSGPPADFGNHSLPTFEDTLAETNLLMPDWQPSTDAKAAATQTSNFNTSPGVGFTVVQVTTIYPSFAPITLDAPDGASYVFDGSTLSCDKGPCGSSEASLRIESFTSSTGGAVAISISGGEVTGGSWKMVQSSLPILTRQARATGKVALEVESLVAFDDNVVSVGIDPDPCLSLSAVQPVCPIEPARSSFDLLEGAAPTFVVRGSSTDPAGQKVERRLDLTGLRVSVEDTRDRSRRQARTYGFNEVASLPVRPDGGVVVPMPALAAGDHSVRIDIEGVLEGVGPIERTAFYFLPIRPQTHRLTGEVGAAPISRGRLELGLGIERLGTGFSGKEVSHLYAYAEVWAKDGQTPVAWVGGMTQPRANALGQLELPVILDARWLALARQRGTEYLLRNVRLQDPDSFVMVHEVAEMPFSVERLPAAALEPITKAALADPTLTRGHGDRTIDLPAVEDTHGPTKTGLDTGIFLVHGWCSGPFWQAGMFDPTGLVGGTEQFSDPGQSRSHDNFAQRIRNQGDACFADSFSVVAHSQGGAASVHLRAFYDSGLDASTAPRRIQSVGTPYRGTTLMNIFIDAGPLAWLIAEIIGDCTPQVNLSTLGAALWGISIPNWARDDVFYYRTRHFRPGNFWQRLEFWRWRCNITSFVIPGNDDGTVSITQGLFGNANDMGIVDGQCHTGNMTHMNQTDQKDDPSRNDIMNEEGRPDPPAPIQANCEVERTWQTGGPDGNGYWKYEVDASGSTGPVSEYRWRNDGGSWGPWGTTTSYGPLFPGLPGQASSYFIWVQVRAGAGNVSQAGCAVP